MDGALAYFMDFYTQNPASYYPTRFLAAGPRSPAPRRRHRRDLRRCLESAPPRPIRHRCLAAKYSRIVQVPPYPTPLATTSDPLVVGGTPPARAADRAPRSAQGPPGQFRRVPPARGAQRRHLARSSTSRSTACRGPATACAWADTIRPDPPRPAPARAPVPPQAAPGRGRLTGRLRRGARRPPRRGPPATATGPSTSYYVSASAWIEAVDLTAAAGTPAAYGDPTTWSEGGQSIAHVPRPATATCTRCTAHPRASATTTSRRACGAPLATGDPAGFVDAGGNTHVLYPADGGHLWEMWWYGSGSARRPWDVTAAARPAPCRRSAARWPTSASATSTSSTPGHRRARPQPLLERRRRRGRRPLRRRRGPARRRRPVGVPHPRRPTPTRWCTGPPTVTSGSCGGSARRRSGLGPDGHRRRAACRQRPGRLPVPRHRHQARRVPHRRRPRPRAVVGAREAASRPTSTSPSRPSPRRRPTARRRGRSPG